MKIDITEKFVTLEAENYAEEYYLKAIYEDCKNSEKSKSFELYRINKLIFKIYIK